MTVSNDYKDIGEKQMKTGLFRAIRRRLSLTHDNDMGAFREKIELLVSQKDKLSDDEIASKVEELKGLCADLPDSEDKEKLGRFLDDFNKVKEQDANVAKEAAKQISDLFEKLDLQAIQDTPDTKTTGDNAPEETDEVAEEEVEETKAPKSDKVQTLDGDDTGDKYTLNEIYEFIKERLAKDSEDDATDDDGEGVEESLEENEEETEDEDCGETDEDEIVSDHAPYIPVKMTKDHGSKNALDALLAMAKGDR